MPIILRLIIKKQTLNQKYLDSIPTKSRAIQLSDDKKFLIDFERDIVKKAVQILIKDGVDVNSVDENGNTALMIAAQKNYWWVVETLTKAGSNLNFVNKNGENAIMLAAQNGNSRIVEILNKISTNLNSSIEKKTFSQDRSSALGGKDTPKAKIDTDDHTNSKPAINNELIKACYNNDIRAVENLIKAGTDLNLIDENGNTALMIAAQNDRLWIVRKLVEAGADLNIANHKSETALILATQERLPSIIFALIDAGADLNSVDKNGNTALIIAAQKGYIEIVVTLKAAGADLTIANNKNEVAQINDNNTTYENL